MAICAATRCCKDMAGNFIHNLFFLHFLSFLSILSRCSVVEYLGANAGLYFEICSLFATSYQPA